MKSTIAKVRPELHLFTIDSRNFAYDINSSNLFELDDIGWEMLRHWGNLSREELVEKLKENFDVESIIETLEDFEQLQAEGFLFSSSPAVISDHEDANLTALALLLASGCNLRCTYCFNDGGEAYNKENGLMLAETALKGVDFLVEHSNTSSQLKLSFFGGEPLLNFKVIKTVVEYSKRIGNECGKHFSYGITTNATLLDDEIIDFLIENNFAVMISLDGPKEVNDSHRIFPDGRGTYERITKNISNFQQRLPMNTAGNNHNSLSSKEREYLRKRGFLSQTRLVLRATFTKQSLLFLEEIFRHFISLGIKDICIAGCEVAPDAKEYIGQEELSKIIEGYKKIGQIYLELSRQGEPVTEYYHLGMLSRLHNRYQKLTACGAGANLMAITPSGDIYPCHRLAGLDEYRLGNLHDGSWNRVFITKFRQATSIQKPACQNCWARYLCGGGCVAFAAWYNNDIFQPYEIYCELNKRLIEQTIAIYAQLMEEQPSLLDKIAG